MEMFPKTKDDRDRPDRQRFYPGDRDDRELLQAIKWKPLSGNRDDPKLSQNTALSPRFHSACVSKRRQMKVFRFQTHSFLSVYGRGQRLCVMAI